VKRSEGEGGNAEGGENGGDDKNEEVEGDGEKKEQQVYFELALSSS
jgi:hypothetical protein